MSVFFTIFSLLFGSEFDYKGYVVPILEDLHDLSGYVFEPALGIASNFSASIYENNIGGNFMGLVANVGLGASNLTGGIANFMGNPIVGGVAGFAVLLPILMIFFGAAIGIGKLVL